MSDFFDTQVDQIIVFTIDGLSYALSLQAVVKVIHAIEIRHLPKAPEIICGIINVKGKIIPVIDIRKRCGFATREIELNDQLIIANTIKRQVAIIVDNVEGVKEFTDLEIADTREILPFTEHIKGVAKMKEGIMLIYDLDQFLSLDEEKKLDYALKTDVNET